MESGLGILLGNVQKSLLPTIVGAGVAIVLQVFWGIPGNASAVKILTNVSNPSVFEVPELSTCVVSHPGFRSACVKPFALDLISDQYKNCSRCVARIWVRNHDTFGNQCFLFMLPCVKSSIVFYFL